MKLSIPITLLAVSLTVTAKDAPQRRSRTAHDGLVRIKRGESTLGDDKCNYPAPAADFNVSNFAGPTPEAAVVWYRLASRDEPVMKDCTCTTARYGLFANGSLSAHTTCMLNNTLVDVKGRADPVENFQQGAYRTYFGKPLTGPCPGPNMIVQKVWTSTPDKLSVNTGPGPYQVVLVTTPSNDWYLLGTTRQVDRAVLDVYLKQVAAVGNSLDEPWSVEDQSKCPDQPDVPKDAKPKDDLPKDNLPKDSLPKDDSTNHKDDEAKTTKDATSKPDVEDDTKTLSSAPDAQPDAVAADSASFF